MQSGLNKRNSSKNSGAEANVLTSKAAPPRSLNSALRTDLSSSTIAMRGACVAISKALALLTHVSQLDLGPSRLSFRRATDNILDRGGSVPTFATKTPIGSRGPHGCDIVALKV